MVKLFLDSSNPEEIKESIYRGVIHGVTTNPSILAKSPIKVEHLLEMAGERPVSVDAMNLDPLNGRYPDNLVVKIPVGWEGLSEANIGWWIASKRPVNITACMTFHQALLAAQMGAAYVSLFWGRIRDGKDSPNLIVSKVSQMLKGSQTQLIVGSIRSLEDIEYAVSNGADIVTVPYKFFEPMTRHPETDKVVAQFRKDAQG